MTPDVTPFRVRALSEAPSVSLALFDHPYGAALDELRARGCTRVSLDTTEPLRRAMGFYEAQGFRRTGRVRDFFGMPLHEYVRALE